MSPQCSVNYQIVNNTWLKKKKFLPPRSRWSQNCFFVCNKNAVLFYPKLSWNLKQLKLRNAPLCNFLLKVKVRQGKFISVYLSHAHIRPLAISGGLVWGFLIHVIKIWERPSLFFKFILLILPNRNVII